MRESSTYRAILAEGRREGRREGRTEGKVEAKREDLLRFGTKRLGAPDAPTRARVEAIEEVADLDRILDRLFEVENWDELLA